jgi:FkbM family methyltransferase
VELTLKGRSYWLHLPDAATDYIQKKVATERQPYEREMLEEMQRWLKPGELVVDAGANVGNHTIFLAAIADCRVEAFEPNPSLAAAIRTSVAVNSLGDRVRVHAVGLGAQAGRARFDADRPENLGARRLLLDSGEVDVVSLDSLGLDGPVRALKIDVEGMELDVLSGAAGLIERDRPLIFVECIDERGFREVSRWLDAQGYTYWDTYNATPTHQFLPAETVSPERRVSRLQLSAVRDGYRQAALAASVRQKLTRAYDNERQAKDQSATLARDLAVRDAELREARAAASAGAGALSAVRSELAAAHGRLDDERRRGSAAEAAARESLAAVTEQARVAAAGLTTARDALLSTRLELDAAKAAHHHTQRELATLLSELGARKAAHEAALLAGRALQEQAAALTLERDAAVHTHADLKSVQARLQAEQARLESELQASLRAGQGLQHRLEALAFEGEALRRSVAESSMTIKGLREERQKLQRFLEVKSARLDATQSRLERTRASGAYLAGAALAAGSRSMGDALRLPQRLWQIYRDRASRRAARGGAAALPAHALTHEVLPATPQKPSAQAKQLAVSAQAAGRRLAGRAEQNAAGKALSATQLPTRPSPAPLRPIDSLRQLRVACIADEFTYHSFAPEAELLQLRSDRWLAQVQAFQPDIVFIESAWRGEGDSWQHKVSTVSSELVDLIAWAMQAGVPTAFWCKEDPVHYVRFLPVARLVDHVFTTDIDCIPRYMAALMHDRVHLLPFAAQPALHNPVETGSREDAFCFAGSYYHKYPERQADFHEVVTVARKLRSVVIYDRNSNRPKPHDFVFPDEYRPELRDALDYAEVDKAYKGYRFGITVNTIKHSQTMFARRAFELMACNTVVVSNFSRGLRMLFGDLVVASDNARELEHRLAPICADERRYRALRLRALRCVLGEHTYAHRLAYMASCIAGRSIAAPQPRVVVVAEVDGSAHAARVVAAVQRQTWHDIRLLLIGPAGTDVGGQPLLDDRAALVTALADDDYVAVFDPADHHGPDYLRDMALATCFAPDDGVTKAAFHTAGPDGSVRLHCDGQQYKRIGSATLRRSLVRASTLRSALSSAEGPLGDIELRDRSFVALDEFSYCEEAQRAGLAFAADSVEAAHTGRLPPAFATTVQRVAEAIVPAADGRDDAAPHFNLSVDDLARLLPKQFDTRIMLSRDAKHRIVIDSQLPAGEHAYLYLGRRLAPAELMSAAEMEAESDGGRALNLCTVFVFRNATEQKISQLTDPAGKPHAMRLPAGTDHVRVALRIQGPGRASVGGLTVTPARHAPVQAIAPVEHLVVARGYPDYGDLYRYAFVHSRVRAYARAGQPAQVFCVGKDQQDAQFREFEDIDVTEADAATLDDFLASGRHRNALVHIIDPGLWEVVARHLDRVRVTIWVHGAEIQPWWRRVFGEPDSRNEWARRTTDARLRMWREILCRRHPNLTVVFISHKQLREALGDLDLRAADIGRVAVIHNFVDTDRFAWRPKPPEQRKRILSIRPYSSAVYANDLAVRAIERLSLEPFFGELRFRLIGDGKLFDETVAPLRRYTNVEISKGFITQAQIAEVHRDYGVFLVPSRMDSQGVSRDEAMSSGLVPVTNRISAIPDFVDPSCGFLAEPEDAEGLARAIATLYHEPARFEEMSAAAARRVRGQSGYGKTVARELALMAPDREPDDGALQAALMRDESAKARIAIYGDVNLNIVDGSAIWAASLAETFAAAPGVGVFLLLKARIRRTLVLSRLLDLAPQVQLIEPPIPENGALTPAEAVAAVVALDARRHLRAVVLRGLQVCDEASRVESLRGRLWAYLTDIPQRSEEMDDITRARIESIVAHSELVLCQTPQMEAYLHTLFPTTAGRTCIVPPMIPQPEPERPTAVTAGPFRLAYAGKFAPRWGIVEMLDAFDNLRAADPEAELHVYGDKIHQSTEVPGFRDSVQARLQGGQGVFWHGAVDRGELMRDLASMHACWAFRDPAFERECLELSTKALEYASLGVPVILARGAVNESVFGAGYPLFADDAAEAAALLRKLAAEPEFRAEVAQSLGPIAARFCIPAVRDRLIQAGLLPRLVDDFTTRPADLPVKAKTS